MTGLPVFWCVPTGEGIVRLRRFTFSTDGPCSSGWGHSAASGPVGRIPYVAEVLDGDRVWPFGPAPEEYRAHPAWPPVCETCGYEFSTEMPEEARILAAGRDNWSVDVDPLYRPTVAALDAFSWGDAPPGAMRDGWGRKGPDGICLQVRCPRSDGSPSTIADDWLVDSRASNCALPDDSVHYCWVRRGDPRAVPPTVTVSKDGPTCAAGAGSIQTHRWHGFLRDGELVT